MRDLADDEDTGLRHRMRLTGDVQLGAAGSIAILRGFELERHGELDKPGGLFRLTLRGDLAQLRKLAAVHEGFAKTLGLVADEAGDRDAKLALRATDPLIADLAAALPETAATIQDAFEVEPWLALVFALDRYEPESVGIVTSESIE